MKYLSKEFISVDEPMESTKSYDVSKTFDMNGTVRLPDKFKAWNKLILRDLNSNTNSPSFYLYSKDKITEFLKNPYKNQEMLLFIYMVQALTSDDSFSISLDLLILHMLYLHTK